MPHLMTVPEFVARYGVSRSRVYELLANGELTALKVGRATRIPDDAAEAWKAKLPAFQPRSARAESRATA